MNFLPDPPQRQIDRLPHPKLGDRSLFPDLEASVYLNHAAVSPPSTHVLACANAVPLSYAKLGTNAFPLWIAQRNRLRKTIATLIGAKADDIGLVPSTSMGIATVAMSIDWRPGDRIILFEGEFPTNVTPWQRAAKTFDLEIQMLPLDGFGDGSGQGLARLEKEIQKGARLVAASAVQFQTGLAMPLNEIGTLCKKGDTLFSVDAIQAVGCIPLDVRKADIDFLIAGSHKWLMGLEGCGFVYMAAHQIEQMVPRLAGWLSHEDGLDFLFRGSGYLRYDRPIRRRADWIEMGAQNALGFAVLEASIDLLLHLGIVAIYEHISEWIDRIEPKLEDRGFRSMRSTSIAGRSGILSLVPPSGKDVIDIGKRLNEAGIAVSTPDGYLRLAPHWPNSFSEVDTVLSEIDRFLQ